MEGSRLSAYSNYSNVSRSNPSPSAQVSTQTLLNALHTSYSASQSLSLESSATLVVNTWLTVARQDAQGRSAASVDPDLARRAWEHARRRAEDGCIVLGSLHESTPSLLTSFIDTLPFSTPQIVYTAISAIRPFLTCVTPQNPSLARHSSLAATFTLSLAGNLTGASLRLSTSGIDTSTGLLNLPQEQGYRAFDVFYYLLSSASTPQEREALGLRLPSQYLLLKRSGTYAPPSYLPTADDAAAAEEFRDSLKAIGISGRARRDLLSILAALLKLGDTVGYILDEDELQDVCEEAAGLMDLEPDVLMHKCSTEERQQLVAGIYEALVDFVVSHANLAIAADFSHNKKRRSFTSSMHSGLPGALTPTSTDDEEETASITVLEIPSPDLGKAVALRTVFDDTEGINAEMKQDGVPMTSAGHSVLTEMQAAVAHNEVDLGITSGHAGREKELEKDRREAVLDKVGHEVEPDAFLETLLHGYNRPGRFDLMSLIGSSRVWFHLCLHPTDESPASIGPTSAPWSAGSLSRQLRAWRLPEWANRRNKQLDYTADFDMDEFCARYSRLGCKEGRDGIESFLLERGWSNGEVVIGTERVWIREGSWWEAESMLDMLPADHPPPDPAPIGAGYQVQHPDMGSGFFGSSYGDNATIHTSQDNLLQRNQSALSMAKPKSLAPTAAVTVKSIGGGDYGLGYKGDEVKGLVAGINDVDPELIDPNHIQEVRMTRTRRIWITLVWALTFWIPSFVLKYIGRMKRPDVRMAWREKLTLVAFILFLNGVVCFYIIIFGHLLCPNLDKAWNDQQVSYHQGDNDFYVSVAGRVYDVTHFWRQDHSKVMGAPAGKQQTQPLAGQNLSPLFQMPLYVACPGMGIDKSYKMQFNSSAYNSAVVADLGGPGQHLQGAQALYPNSKLTDDNWYSDTFLPFMKQYYKGELVYATKDIQKAGNQLQKPWFWINDNVYDLTQYFYNIQQVQAPSSHFLDPQVEQMVQNNPGTDLTNEWNNYVASNATGSVLMWQCLNNEFYIGKTDFRTSARCQVNNYILLVFTVILCSVILVKFLSALQFGGKKRPAQQDKFVICQVPAYTEGEEHLRKGLDSLTAMSYDNKRKLIFVMCDGMIVGGGNDRPTPKIVLDILGVDPKIDPPALPFKSVGSGSEKLNYGKVYSGLYEYEGNVVPYLVVVKVGKESEQNKAKPGNRGKRDSQIMLMQFLNRIHHRTPMNPLELEMFHQINNIIGVDPELYEYLFMVDADTMVKEDALNRLVAACAHNAKIAGICGETSLENEERSWTTMIQVYEYYISHHLAKAFESLFGSVTCLPGCFCMYRLRTADRGKPLIINQKVIDDYSIQDVDTLHKKNLLALGEDRYLTTLMTKHFPFMSYKFVAGAHALTAAPESWSVLLSQRRRWINSTIHNLCELVFLKDLCGFCCFSMRFVVFIDLFGTLILPATCVYLIYLIYRVATHQGAFPIISIVIIAAVYGLQAIIFILRRQWQHIGWMMIYILAYPIYSMVLPIYAFWKQDDFSWGNTRIVIGEKGNKQVIAMEDEGFDPRSIPLQTWDDYAYQNNLPGRRGYTQTPGGFGSEKGGYAYAEGEYEMDDIRSVYSGAGKSPSTILTGFKSSQPGGAPTHSGFYMAPMPSPGYPSGMSNTPRPGVQQRQSGFSQLSGRYTDNPSPAMSPYPNVGSPAPQHQSTENLLGQASPGSMPLNRAGRRSPLSGGRTTPGAGAVGPAQSRPASTVNFTQYMSGHGEPSDGMIIEAIQACLMAVDLETVTKKQLKALAEQRLQCQLSAERRQFLDRQIDAELANM